MAAFTEDDTGAPKPWQWGVQWIGWENLHRKPSIFHEDHGEFVMRNSKMVWITQLNSMSPYYRGKCGCNTRISHMNVTYFSVFSHIHMISGVCKRCIYIPQENNMFIGKMMKGHFNSIFRQNQVEVFWAKRMSWQLTNWKFVTRIEKFPLQQKKCNWNIHHHLNHRSEIWQLKSAKIITPLKHRKSPKKTTTRCILLKVPAGSCSWKLWKWTT